MSKWIVSVLFFVMTLFVVEASPIGSMAVAKYNQGYGTFDMKKYDSTVVRNVLGNMEEKGLFVYKCYYLADMLFLIAFGFFQILLLQAAFAWMKRPEILLLLCLIPLLRGAADLVENVILCTTLFRYPVVSDGWIWIASIATTIKLLLIQVWAEE